MQNDNETLVGGMDLIRLSNYQAAIILLLSLIMSVITICGNILVLFSFYIEPGLRISTNYFIASLAVTDLLIGLISMNLYTTYIVLGHWPLGELLCDLWLSMDYTACLTSQYTVFLITVDRYCSITMPLKYHELRSGKIIGILIFFTWTIPSVIFYSIIMSWPYTVGRKRRTDECYAEFSIRPVFITVLTVCYFWSTLIVMIILYVGIYRVALDLQRKSDARKAKVNKYLLISLSTKPNNSDQCQSKKETNTSTSKDEESFHYIATTYEDDSLRHTHSSCFVLEYNDLPSNIESPSIEEACSINSDLVPDNITTHSLPLNDHSTIHHHISCNIHYHYPCMLCLHSQISCTIPGVEFIDLDNFESSLRLNTISSNGHAQDSKTKLIFSPIWEEHKKALTATSKPDPRSAKQCNNKRPSMILKSPLINLGSRVQGLIQKSKERQFTVNRNINRAKKALKTISLILGAFIMCWTPFHIVILIKAASDDPNLKESYINGHVYRLAYWLCYINSPLNPFCYALSNVQIKETFFRILTCKIKLR